MLGPGRFQPAFITPPICTGALVAPKDFMTFPHFTTRFRNTVEYPVAELSGLPQASPALLGGAIVSRRAQAELSKTELRAIVEAMVG